MVEPQPSKLMTWVRFPLPAPNFTPTKWYKESMETLIFNFLYGINYMSSSQETFEALRNFNIIEGRKIYMEKLNKNEEPKILVSKVQHILEWTKTKIYLDTNSDKAKNRIVRRGEVYKCNFGIGIGSEMQKERPCVIIQSDVGNINSSNVIVAPITHTSKPIPSMAHIISQKDNNGITILDGQVNLSNIQTVSKARLGNYITKLSKEDISNIDNALYVSLGLMKNIKKYEEKIENLNKYIEKLKEN